MKEEKKSREELLQEVAELRREVERLQQMVSTGPPQPRGMLPPEELQARVAEHSGLL